MTRLSTREAAKKLGISYGTLAKYVAAGKVPEPERVQQGERTIHIWTDQEIETLRKLLPKIVNGRKTRWQRQREAEAEKQIKAKKTPRVPVPHKKKGTRKKK